MTNDDAKGVFKHQFLGRTQTPEEMIVSTAQDMREDKAGWSPGYRDHYANIFEYAHNRIAALEAEVERLRRKAKCFQCDDEIGTGQGCNFCAAWNGHIAGFAG